MGHPSQRRRLVLGSLLLFPSLMMAAPANVEAALGNALQPAHASGIVVEAGSGRTLARVGATDTPSAPGSLLKPLFLAAALKRNYVTPQTAVLCRRSLLVRDTHRTWNLSCAHPQSNTAFRAQEALAYSCNRYFANLADRIPPGEAEAILEHYGLRATAPQSIEQKELLVLGLAGILVTPLQVAVAYRRLAGELDHEASAQPVRAGLEDSVTYGMAHNAALPGVEILGKTGTATDKENGRSHGWFVGMSRMQQRPVVIVIYVPGANGADAAQLAHNFFAAALTAP